MCSADFWRVSRSEYLTLVVGHQQQAVCSEVYKAGSYIVISFTAFLSDVMTIVKNARAGAPIRLLMQDQSSITAGHAPYGLDGLH